ncbi:MAG: hypothetical protein WC023_01700 [Rhodocyclaceae bacterium]
MSDQKIIESYSRLKNLKLVGEETGIAWQKVYLRLRANNIPVTGDKGRYGSNKDRFAAKAEAEFQKLVPSASNSNKVKFQAATDFTVGSLTVDVKASTLHRQIKERPARRWAFSVKKQEFIADFVVLFAFLDDGSYRLILVPGEMIRTYQSLSIGERWTGKWADYEIAKDDLLAFFTDLSDEKAA